MHVGRPRSTGYDDESPLLPREDQSKIAQLRFVRWIVYSPVIAH
jgi:hypothetical protein